MSSRIYLIEDRESGQTLVGWLRKRLQYSGADATRLVRQRRVRVAGALCLDPNRRLRAGQRVEVEREGGQKAKPKGERTETPAALPAVVLRHADDEVVVVEKPAGLTTMRHASDVAEFGERARKYLPATLADLLPPLLGLGGMGRHPEVRAVHRLDRETSGLVVFARTVAAERNLGEQFRAHTTERTYLAVVRGRAVSGRIESRLVENRGDGRRGSGGLDVPGQGQRAVTHVRVVEELGEYTLVECRLETGRTHQVRIHLGEAGTPLCGERIYDRPLHGKPLPDRSGAKRIALHAASLSFDHPASRERMRFTSPLPGDLAELVERLREHGTADQS